MADSLTVPAINGDIDDTIKPEARIRTYTEEWEARESPRPMSSVRYEKCLKAATVLRGRVPHRPEIAIICGSGLGSFAEHLSDTIEIPFREIPGFPVSTVHGHKGALVFGHISNIEVLCMSGRVHYYEGYAMQEVTFPVRVMKLLGIKVLIVSNAAGGINNGYHVGDIMLINDHVCFPGLAGMNPLRGQNDERFGPRFVSLSNVYDYGLRQLARLAASDSSLMTGLHEGVFAMVSGPTFETPAELRLLRMLGVDSVGMSTAPEVTVAHQTGIRCLAFSLITNKAVTDIDTILEPNHEEVLAIGKSKENYILQFITKLIEYVNKDYIPKLQ